MKAFRNIILLGLMLLPAVASADVSLQVLPLKYEDTIKPNVVSRGYVEVSNPSDTTVTVTAKVRAFRQTGLDGNLQFYDNAQYQQGIIPDLPEFELGAREAIRESFSVDPSRLPKGGIFAVLFFQTKVTPSSSNNSYITESANIGTLLILQNGPATPTIGKLTRINLPIWQLGKGISGDAVVTNSDQSNGASAIKSALTTRVLPFGRRSEGTSSLILPGSSRTISISKSGSYFGLLPLSVSLAGGPSQVKWVIAITGIYRYISLPLLIAIGLVIFGTFRYWRTRKKPAKKILVRDIIPLRKP